jgi:hypothetical protein
VVVLDGAVGNVHQVLEVYLQLVHFFLAVVPDVGIRFPVNAVDGNGTDQQDGRKQGSHNQKGNLGF